MSTALVQIRDLKFTWPGNTSPTIDCAEFTLNRGEHVFIGGPSGSGKSTLLNLIAAVLVAQAGSLSLLGEECGAMSATGRDRLRADRVGFIFQQFNLLPYLSLVENVLLPCRFSRRRESNACQAYGSSDRAARYLLEQLFTRDNLDISTPAARLSVGQQQRVAAARALIGSPDVLIADEPTSSLDADARGRFMDLLFEQAGNARTTLLFVSHDSSLSEHFDRVVGMDLFTRGV